MSRRTAWLYPAPSPIASFFVYLFKNRPFFRVKIGFAYTTAARPGFSRLASNREGLYYGEMARVVFASRVFPIRPQRQNR